jgi:hypothetical protein
MSRHLTSRTIYRALSSEQIVLEAFSKFYWVEDGIEGMDLSSL